MNGPQLLLQMFSRQTGINGHASERFSIVLPSWVVGRNHLGNPSLNGRSLPPKGSPIGFDMSGDGLPTGYKRACFICGSEDGPVFEDEVWEVVAVGTVRKAIRVCSGCGLTLQDPAVPPEKMARYYETVSNYTNPSRDGRPHATKIRAVGNQLDFLAERGVRPGRVFEVGGSDGYTLHRFRDTGWVVLGCDPSPAAVRIARELWGIDQRVSFIEDYTFSVGEVYDLIVITHVLEHIYDPVEALVRCREGLSANGLVLVEVPVLCEPSKLPPGYLTFEHVNYFTKASIKNTLAKAGFHIAGEIEVDFNTNIEVDFNTNMYPIMRLLAAPGSEVHHAVFRRAEVDATKATVSTYVRQEANTWRAFDALLRSRLADARRCVIFGAGIHTSILLARTGILSYAPVIGIVDSDPQKWNLSLADVIISSPEVLDYADPELAIVISTAGGEAEILNAIRQKEVKAVVVALYEELR